MASKKKCRMVSIEMNLNYRVAKLPYEPHDAQKFYIGMCLQADKEGRLPGETKLLSKIIWPHCDYSEEEVAGWLELMESLKDDETGYGLIERYEVNGHKYIRLTGWDYWQPRSYRVKEAESRIPSPPYKKKVKKKPGRPIADDILDPRLADMVKAYEYFKGSPITPSDSDLIKEVYDDYPDGWLEKGIEEARKHNARSIKYIMKILLRWKDEGEDPLAGVSAKVKPPDDEGDGSAGMKVEE